MPPAIPEAFYPNDGIPVSSFLRSRIMEYFSSIRRILFFAVFLLLLNSPAMAQPAPDDLKRIELKPAGPVVTLQGEVTKDKQIVYAFNAVPRNGRCDGAPAEE